jgi:2'-5' RNA ligase
VPLRCIATFPKFQGLELIEEFRLQFHPQAREIPAHLTLVFPFESQMSHEELLAHVQLTTRRTSPLHIVLGGISKQEEGYLFLNVAEGGDLVTQLYDQLNSGPLEKYRSLRHRFLPHMTIGLQSDPVELQRAFEAGDRVKGPFSAEIDRLSILRIESPKPDVIEAIISLEG